MTNSLFGHTLVTFLIASVVLFSSGCGSSSGKSASKVSASENSKTASETTSKVPASAPETTPNAPTSAPETAPTVPASAPETTPNTPTSTPIVTQAVPTSAPLTPQEVPAPPADENQADEGESISGYYEAGLTGHPTEYAYIDSIITSDDDSSISFSGVFREGEYTDSNWNMTDYMTLTVITDENTTYVGSDEFDVFYYSKDEFLNIVKSFNGLGLGLTVDNGILIQARLMS